jgi:uncharacterized protein
MVGMNPEQRVLVPVSHQRWQTITFVHFGFDPRTVAELLPAGLEPDVHEGLAWVGITPFRLHASVVPVSPGPKVVVGEANVRTYARRSNGGEDGIWFLSLHLDQGLVAAGLRIVSGLPYEHATVEVDDSDDTVSYRVAPAGRGGTFLEMEVDIREDVLAPDPLDAFLVGRWRAFIRRLGRVLTVPVWHPPWPLRRAQLRRLEQSVLVRYGLTKPVTDPHVLFSVGVDTRVGLPRL